LLSYEQNYFTACITETPKQTCLVSYSLTLYVILQVSTSLHEVLIFMLKFVAGCYQHPTSQSGYLSPGRTPAQKGD